jgi:predicted CxxxxCH...CXXCH cytochrome family protein
MGIRKLTTSILRFKNSDLNTYIYSFKLSKLTFTNKNLCFKYTYDMFNIESCSDTSCHGTIQILRAQVQKQTPKWSNSYTWAHITLQGQSGLLNHLPLDSRLQFPSEVYFILTDSRPELTYSDSWSSTWARPAKREACVQHEQERLQESVLNRHRRG